MKIFQKGMILAALILLLAFTIDSSVFMKPEPVLISIPGGEYTIGQEDGEGDEKPEHQVVLSDFLIGKYEVTVAEFKVFCDAPNRAMPREPKWGWKDDHPIVNTSWNDAQSYIDWLNESSDENYRLPTEAEFEYVIRNGGEQGVFPWGKDRPQDENLADISFGAANESNRIWKNYDDGFAFTAPVGSFEPNKLGVYDINGNIWEWCSDWYDDYPNQKLMDPKGPESGTHKVGRGGSYNADPWHSRTASRAFVKPTFQGPGFRLAKDKN